MIRLIAIAGLLGLAVAVSAPAAAQGVGPEAMRLVDAALPDCERHADEYVRHPDYAAAPSSTKAWLRQRALNGCLDTSEQSIRLIDNLVLDGRTDGARINRCMAQSRSGQLPGWGAYLASQVYGCLSQGLAAPVRR